MASLPERLRIAKSAETLETPESPAEKYLYDLENDLKEDIERNLIEKTPIGEGRAGQVFNLEHMDRTHFRACAKVWRPELQDIRKNSLIEYKSIQTLEPEEEFELQDALYMEGFRHIPRPLAYTHAGQWHMMGMEKITGYTLQEIKSKNARIADPVWKDLFQILFELNIKHGIVHRDLHPGNIILQTEEKLAPRGVVSGKLYIVDLGLAKRISHRPTPEDYTLTIGGTVIKFPEDRTLVEKLKSSFVR